GEGDGERRGGGGGQRVAVDVRDVGEQRERVRAVGGLGGEGDVELGAAGPRDRGHAGDGDRAAVGADERVALVRREGGRVDGPVEGHAHVVHRRLHLAGGREADHLRAGDGERRRGGGGQRVGVSVGAAADHQRIGARPALGGEGDVELGVVAERHDRDAGHRNRRAARAGQGGPRGAEAGRVHRPVEGQQHVVHRRLHLAGGGGAQEAR